MFGVRALADAATQLRSVEISETSIELGPWKSKHTECLHVISSQKIPFPKWGPIRADKIPRKPWRIG